MSQLSQQSLLQKVQSWSEQQCKDDYDSVMPKILHEIGNTSSRDAVELCSLVLEKFVCHAMIGELGQRIFNTVSLKLGRVFNETLENLPAPHKSSIAQSTLTEMLKYLVEVLGCYNGFILRLASIVKSATDIELLYISEFSNNTIDILQRSYFHCKNSEKDYGQAFQHVSGLLGILFQKTYGMQKNFGLVIANIKYSPELILSDETKVSVEKLCEGLLSVCKITCTVDNTLLTSTWTTMIKFMREFKDVVQEAIYPNPYIVLLCDNIIQCIRYSFQLHDRSHHLLNSGDEATKKALNQSLKYSKLLMSVFYEVIKIFDTMSNQDLANHILTFFHDFHVLFGVKDSTNCSLVAKIKFRCKMMDQLPHYEHAVALILNNDHFLDCLCTFSYDSQRQPDYGWLHVWLSIGKELLKSKSTMTQWGMKSVDCTVVPVLLVQLIVECVGPTHNVFQSHLNRGASLFETNLAIVCSLVSKLSPDSFLKAEETMFDLVFSSSPDKNIFAADVLTFFAKSSPSLSKRYKSVVCTILATMNEVKKVTFPMLMLISIFNRIGVSPKDLVKNLSSNSKALPDWWTLIQTSRFDHTDISCAKVRSDVLNISQQDEISVFNMRDLSGHMVQFELALTSPSTTKKELPLFKSIFSSVIDIVDNFEKFDKKLTDSIIFSGFLSHFLACLKYFRQFLDKSEKTKVLKYFQTILTDCSALPIKLGIIGVLWRYEDAPSENLETICAIFKRLFLDENLWIRHLSLTAFITLTLLPSHTSLLERCACDPAISKIIESYLTFDSQSPSLFCAPLPEPDCGYDVKMEECLSSWRNRICKRSDGIFHKKDSCLDRDCFQKYVSQMKVDMQKLNQCISQNSINRNNIGAVNRQNLSLIKTEFDRLLHQFDL